ncbi:MAG: TolC family protein [Proteobacteria bacterium]|nr:TolC family protein [Pseudomonadota bacterium]
MKNLNSSIIVALVVLLLCAHASAAVNSAPADNAAIEQAAIVPQPARQLANQAVSANPGLAALRQRSAELEQLAEVAANWDDPRLSVDYLNTPVDSLALDDSPMSGLQFKLSQKIPRLGWTGAARELADARLQGSRHESAEAELLLRRQVATLYWKLVLTRGLRRITGEHIARTGELLRAVRAHYEVGKAGQNAVLRLTVLRDRLRDDLGDFDRREVTLVAALTRALASPAAQDFVTGDSVEPLAPVGNSKGWSRLAQQRRPVLAALAQRARSQRAGARMAGVKARPGVSLWVGYRLREIDTALDDGSDFVSAGFSVPLPLSGSARERGRQRAYMNAELSALSMLADRENEIAATLAVINADWTRAFGKAGTYDRTLIPAARATLETTLSDFSVGKADFSSLYESQVELLRLQEAWLRAAVGTHIYAAAAVAETGVSHTGELR